MRDRPTGITERAVARALADGWGLLAGEIAFMPLSGGAGADEHEAR